MVGADLQVWTMVACTLEMWEIKRDPCRSGKKNWMNCWEIVDVETALHVGSFFGFVQRSAERQGLLSTSLIKDQGENPLWPTETALLFAPSVVDRSQERSSPINIPLLPLH